MTDVLLLHHALGITPGITALAAQLRNAGHRVTTPDLFDGRTFESITDGVAFAEELGLETVMARGVAAAGGLGDRLVVIGFSLGVLPAQKLAQTRPGVTGAVLCHAAVPMSMFADSWPGEVGLQLHLAEEDPWVKEDLEAATHLAASVPGSDLFLYPGHGHLIADSSSPDYDAAQAHRLIGRILEFLAERDDRSHIDPEGRPKPPDAADELTTLLGFLDYQRATLEWKCSRLGSDGLAATVGPTTMTLGGLLKHMAYVEDHWLSRRLYGRDRHSSWDGVDWEADPDWDWNSAAADSPEELFTGWRDAVNRSRDLVARALADGGLDRLAHKSSIGPAPSLRWILVHMIEEYARHNGHADLLRESVDGETGE